MSKYVDSYWVEELPSGVIKMVINCSQREIWYHRLTDYSFIIAGSEDEFDNWDSSVILEVESFLPEVDGIYYKTSMKEKDQLGKNFTVEADYMEKLSSILPAGVEVREITIVSIDAVELYNNYNSRLDEIFKLDTKRDELLNSPL